jgi:hypothetical protein
MQTVCLENFEVYDVKVDDETFKKGLNLYKNLENKLLNRFSEAEAAFGFETEKEINCWDFLSINGNPEKLRNLQNQITNCKTEKINIQMDNTQNRDWLEELEVSSLDDVDEGSEFENLREYFTLDI